MAKAKSTELSVVIPCKNEEKYIGKLFTSLASQDYDFSTVPIYVADAGSTDGTLKIIDKHRKSGLEIEVVKGGLPSVGRNAGARHAKSRYVLFIDADITLGDSGLVSRTLEKMNRENLKCATTNIACENKDIFASLLFGANNISQYLSKYFSPFATGMFMMFDRKRFLELGGFDEEVNYAEDYFLTKKLKGKEFAVVPGKVLTSNRRFKKIGYTGVLKLFLKTAIHSNDEAYFRRPTDYFNDS